MSKQSELTAWAAGLYEGEGSVGLRPDGGIQILITMTDREPLVLFQQAVGMGGLGGPYSNQSKPHWKPTWRYYCYGRDRVQLIFDSFRPWLSPRRVSQFEQKIAAARPPRRLFSHLDLADAQRLYAEGFSTTQIGEALGFKAHTVWRNLSQAGTPMRSRGAKPKLTKEST